MLARRASVTTRKVEDPHLVVERTKGGRVRRVPLTPEAYAFIRQEKQRTGSIHVVPLRPTLAAGIYRRLGKKAGVVWHWHQLRHTFACEYLESGGTIETLRLILGHATVSTTERYARISDQAMFLEFSRVQSGPKSGHMERFSLTP